MLYIMERKFPIPIIISRGTVIPSIMLGKKFKKIYTRVLSVMLKEMRNQLWYFK